MRQCLQNDVNLSLPLYIYIYSILSIFFILFMYIPHEQCLILLHLTCQNIIMLSYMLQRQ